MRIKFTLITVFVCLINCFNARSQSPQWIQTSTPPPGSVWGIVAIGTDLFAGAGNGGIYFSPDNGDTWTQRNGAFPNMEVFTLVTNGSDLFAGTRGIFGGGIYKSSDLGITWINITPPDLNRLHAVSGIAIDGTDIYMCSHGSIDSTSHEKSQIFKASIPGIDSSGWTPFENGLPTNTLVRSLKVYGTKIYAGTFDRGIWVSPTSSPAWSATSGMGSRDYISSITFNGNIGFAGNAIGVPVVYRSVDNGQTWVQSSTAVFQDKPVEVIINDATTVYAGAYYNGVLKSTDNGITWTTFNEGFKDTSGNWFCNDLNVHSLTLKGNTIFAGTDCGVWKRQLANTPVPPVTVSDSLFTFYPNPADNAITIRVGRDHIGSTCTIKNTSGNIVFQGRITNETTTIEVSGLAGGIYFIKVGNALRGGLRFLKK